MYHQIAASLLIFVSSFISFSALSQSIDNNKTYSIVGVGDIVIGLNYPEEDGKPYYPQFNGHKLFSHVADFISSADIAVGNLEGVLLNNGGTPKITKNPKNCYLFRMNENHATHLADAGFDAMSLANNHVRDFGVEGQFSTMRTLDATGITYAGIKKLCETAIMTKNNMRYGFCAFAPNGGTVSIHDYKNAENIVKHLKEICDFVIVSFHGGAEGYDKNRVTREQEEFKGEKRGNVYKFAHRMVDAGADVIFGHGPHVVRGIELYKNRLIAYSLGNFCTPYGINKKGKNGYAPVVKVNVNENGEFVSGKIFSARQTGVSGPIIDAKNIVIHEMARLSKLDFPESKLIITKDGILKSN